MEYKRILIVDDEISILTILKNSLAKTVSSYKIDTVTSGFAALGLLRFKSYNLIITDYKMVGMDGLEFLKTIRIMQPNAKIILMTGFGSDALKAEAERLQVYRYITKPIEIDSFRALVQEALGDIGADPRMVRILSTEQFSKSQMLMEQLKTEVGARCVFTTDLSGQIFSQVGNMDLAHLEEVVTLLSSSIAALLEAGVILAGEGEATGMIYFKTDDKNLCSVNIGKQMFLVLVSETKFVKTSVGLILHFAQRVAVLLDQIMQEANYVPLHQLLHENLNQEIDAELDKLLLPSTPAEFESSPG